MVEKQQLPDKGLLKKVDKTFFILVVCYLHLPNIFQRFERLTLLAYNHQFLLFVAKNVDAVNFGYIFRKEDEFNKIYLTTEKTLDVHLKDLKKEIL